MPTKTASRSLFLIAAILLVGCAGPPPEAERAARNELAIDAAGLIDEVARLSSVQADALRTALQQDPFTYFRIINIKWSAMVCDSFTGEFSRMPAVSLHGDAHLEQYALNSSQRGLDDFDDSVAGPAVLDMVRFLGSVELAIREAGWESERERLFDTFFEGYRRGLEDSDYMPAEPSIVSRIRSGHTRTQDEFLDWADSLMEPIPPEVHEQIRLTLKKLAITYRSVRPEVPSHYYDLKRAGWLRLGFGSALTPKVLMRIEGMTFDPMDDLIVEAKQLSDVSQIGCVSLPATGEVYRVITGAGQVGRLTHEIIAVAPRLDRGETGLGDSWLRSWEPSFQEIAIKSYRSADELAEVVHDSGAQLGAGAIPRERAAVHNEKTLAQMQFNEDMNDKIRETAVEMVDLLLEVWEVATQQQQ